MQNKNTSKYDPQIKLLNALQLRTLVALKKAFDSSDTGES